MRKRRALQGTTRATGFQRPQRQGMMVEPEQPAYSLSDFARYSALRGKFDNRAQPGRRYGQQAGYGRGYIPPRQAIGGWQQPYGMQRQNPNYMGYAPRTAGMYGGRPPMVPQQGTMMPQPMGMYPQRPPMTQQDAMMRPQYSPYAYTAQPWGGYQAVPRTFGNQQWQYNRGWY